MTIGSIIRRARRLAGLSQDVLASEVGVKKQTISKWERDQVHPQGAHLLRLATALHLPNDWFSEEHLHPRATPEERAIRPIHEVLDRRLAPVLSGLSTSGRAHVLQHLFNQIGLIVELASRPGGGGEPALHALPAVTDRSVAEIVPAPCTKKRRRRLA